jgi:5'-nucleotidase
MERRSFIRNTALIAGSTLVAPSLFARNTKIDSNKTITILHTNDTHSTIDPFPDNHSKYPGLGGVARRFNLIERIRAEEKNVLLVDAGDIFQGTPYFNKYRGVLEMKLMKKMRYDFATMGNHDFDIGLDGFKNAIQYTDVPFICSNYDFKNTILDGVTQDLAVKELDGVKVGIFGIGVGLSGLVPTDNYNETKYLDPIEIANEKVNQLQKLGCDLIICLSHLGYSYEDNRISDLVLAESTSGIHLIIGGHTHTFLEKPTEVVNKSGNIVLVNQVGWGGINVGRIDFEIENHRFAKKDVLLVQ